MSVSMRCGVRPVLSRRASGCAPLQMRQSVSPIVRERGGLLTRRSVCLAGKGHSGQGEARDNVSCRVVQESAAQIFDAANFLRGNRKALCNSR